MRFNRDQLLEIIQPHVLRAVVRLHGSSSGVVTDEELQKARLTEVEVQALVQTKRLLPLEDGGYRIQLEV